MKAFVKSWIAVLFTLTICVFGSMNAYAWNSRDDVFILEYKNAPEGTAFADILFKKIEDDKYGIGKDDESPCSSVDLKHYEEETKEGYDGYNHHDYTVQERTIKLDKDCGLAKYDDGYTSLMFRRDLATAYSISDGEYIFETIALDAKEAKNTEISNYYGSLEVAYCDEKGNVLMVTEAYEPEITDKPTNYYVKADGQSLKCTLDHGVDISKGFGALFIGAAVFMALLFVVGIVLIVAAVLIVVLLIRKHKKKKNSSEYRGDYP